MTIHKQLESDLGAHLTYMALVKAMELKYVVMLTKALQLISHIPPQTRITQEEFYLVMFQVLLHSMVIIYLQQVRKLLLTIKCL